MDLNSEILAKFVEISHEDIQELVLRKVKFTPNAESYIEVLRKKLPEIISMTYDNVIFGSSKLNWILHSCSRLPKLQELCMIDMK
jgi:hypothetical protein